MDVGTYNCTKSQMSLFVFIYLYFCLKSENQALEFILIIILAQTVIVKSSDRIYCVYCHHFLHQTIVKIYFEIEILQYLLHEKEFINIFKNICNSNNNIIVSKR